MTEITHLLVLPVHYSGFANNYAKITFPFRVYVKVAISAKDHLNATCKMGRLNVY